MPRHRQSTKAITSYLRDVVRRIRMAFPETRRIILFGSYAYGRPQADSDLDLLVEIPRRSRRRSAYRAIDELLDPRPCGVDLIVKTPREIRQILEDFNPCFSEILRKGHVLYAKNG